MLGILTIKSRENAMRDRRQQENFELWFKKEISTIQIEDAKFTTNVLRKIQAKHQKSMVAPDTWTVWSWFFCSVCLGSLLFQMLIQIDTDALTGPVAECLILLLAMKATIWQYQKSLLYQQ
jgi:hypothetical protein